MSASEPTSPGPRIRREPPTFRRVEVRRTEQLSPRMVRVTLTGADLEGFAIEEPAASVRLLLPPGGVGELVMPVWNGNEFLMADGRRPTLRTFTPRRADPGTRELDLDVVLHGGGVASSWAASAKPGAPAAISGPGRGYTIDRAARGYLVGGDETAIPAISQLLEAFAVTTRVDVRIEVVHADSRIALPAHPRATVEWCELPAGAPPGDALVDAVRGVDLTGERAADTKVWVAGEAAAVQRIRRYLFEERAMARAQTSIRGYWKHGRAGDTDDR